MRTVRSRFLFLLIAVGLVLVSISGHMLWGAREKDKAEQQYRETTRLLSKEEKIFQEAFRQLFDKREPVSAVLKTVEIGQISGSKRPFFESVVTAREVEGRFQKQEDLLYGARRLLEVNENDPVAERYLDEAEKLNKKNLEVVKGLAIESDECRWKRSLSYLAGSVYYRALVFIDAEKEKGKARNLIKQAFDHFERVLSCSQHDRDAQVAIELLHRQYQNIAVRGSSKKLRLSLMPQRGAGQGAGNQKRKGGVH